jgi:hypothetical protein
MSTDSHSSPFRLVSLVLRLLLSSFFVSCRSAGKQCEVQVFEEDTHSLGKPQTALHQWLRTLQFFKMHAPVHLEKL